MSIFNFCFVKILMPISVYYWPNLYTKQKEYIKNCKIDNENRYNTHPIKIPIGEAPIPTKEGENLHIDIYYAQSNFHNFKLKEL